MPCSFFSRRFTPFGSSAVLFLSSSSFHKRHKQFFGRSWWVVSVECGTFWISDWCQCGHEGSVTLQALKSADEYCKCLLVNSVPPQKNKTPNSLLYFHDSYDCPIKFFFFRGWLVDVVISSTYFCSTLNRRNQLVFIPSSCYARVLDAMVSRLDLHLRLTPFCSRIHQLLCLF